MKTTITLSLSIAVSLAIFGKAAAQIHVDWNKTTQTSRTTATLQVVYNPMLRPNSPIFQSSFEALKNLDATYVRYVPWFPYPKAAVAEGKPPSKTETFWDFTYAPVKGQDDAPSGVVVMCFEVTPRVRLERQMAEQRLLNERIVDNAPAGIAFLDADLVFRRVNFTYAHLLGMRVP